MITKTMYVRTVTQYPDPANGADHLTTIGLSFANPATGPGPVNQTLDALSDADAAAYPYGQAVTATFAPAGA